MTYGAVLPGPRNQISLLPRGPFIVSELVKVFFRLCHLVPSTTLGATPSRTYKYRSNSAVSSTLLPTSLLVPGRTTPVFISQASGRRGSFTIPVLGESIHFTFLFIGFLTSSHTSPCHFSFISNPPERAFTQRQSLKVRYLRHLARRNRYVIGIISVDRGMVRHF